ncbi:MAG: hypothetical protein ACFFCW_36675 [Candidatus Hodarchaeota archaeon]
MIQRFGMQLLVGSVTFLLASVIFYAVSASQQPSERVKKGQYFLRRAPKPQFLVTGVSLDDLSKARFPNMYKVTERLAGPFGRTRTLFDKKSQEQVEITVAVYGSVDEAEDATLDLLNSVSAVLRPGNQWGGVIGTHSWYLRSPNGSGAVVFIHNNSLFQLSSPDYNLAERSARSIVGDLIKGVNGVTLGKKVQIPKITDVVVPKDVRKNEKASLNVRALDPSQSKLSFVVTASKGQVLDTDKTNEKIYISTEFGTDELKVYTINEANVVSQVFVKGLTVAGQK